MTNLPQLTIIATCGDTHASFDFIIGFDGGEDDLLTAAHEALLSENDNHDTTAEITLDVQDWETTPEQFRSINLSDTDNVYKWGEYVDGAGSYGDNPDVILAAIECGINADDIEEAYQGSYKDDEDFAQEMADQLGAIDKNAQWPMNCIDWEYAAKELMYDYSEHNGHYFRNI